MVFMACPPFGTNLLPTVGCSFFCLSGFRLASYRGVGVGCEAPYLRYISQKNLDGLCTLLLSKHLCIHPFKVGLCHGNNGLPVSPLLSRTRVSDETRLTTYLNNPPAFSL